MSDGKNSYRGAAIATGLAISLIAAFAIPQYLGEPPKPTPVTVDLHPQLSGTISEIPIQIGQTVKKGDVLIKLSDPQLTQQLASAEQTFQEAKVEGKTPVVDAGMLGGIGSVPRVVNIPVQGDIAPLPSQPIAPAPDPKLLAELKSAQAALNAKPAQVQKLTDALNAAQADKDAATKADESAQTAFADATTRQAAAGKDLDRMNHLWDIGGVAHKKVDAAQAAKATADADLATTQSQVDEAKAKLADLDKRIQETSDQIAKAKQDLDDLTKKVQQLQEKSKTAPQVEAPKPLASTPVKFKKKVIYSTAPIGSTAPVSVKLVPTDDPTKQKAIETSHDDLVHLKSQLNKLTIDAPFDARIIKIIVKPGDQVTKDTIVVVLEPIH